jgi:putative heme-binding domain-containing protein
MLIWWAFEDKALSLREQILELATRSDLQSHPILGEIVLPRLVRRYTAEGGNSGFASSARLLDAAKTPQQLDLLLAAMDEELSGRGLDQLPSPLKDRVTRLAANPEASNLQLRLALRLHAADAVPRAIELLSNPQTADDERLAFISALSESKWQEAVPALLHLVEAASSPAIRSAALQGLSRFGAAEIGQSLIRSFRAWPPDQQQAACDILCSRAAWTLDLLRAIDHGELPKTTLSPEQLRRLQLHKNPEIEALIAKHWGQIASSSSAETQARIDEVLNLLKTSAGDSKAGKQVFANTCGKCHKLFSEGGSIGPDLTGVERRRLDVLVANIVEPSSVIRPEYQNYVALTADGLVLAGLMADSSPSTITLLDAENHRTTLSREDIEQIEPSKVSLMPEKLLDSLAPQQRVDLIAYLKSDQP